MDLNKKKGLKNSSYSFKSHLQEITSLHYITSALEDNILLHVDLIINNIKQLRVNSTWEFLNNLTMIGDFKFFGNLKKNSFINFKSC